MFSETLLDEINPRHLLKHPFYQAWNEGKLSRECLQSYAKQYFFHVNAFPRYVSAVHSLCHDEISRSELAQNLADEEGLTGTKAHPALWVQFAKALGVEKKDLDAAPCKRATSELSKTFTKNTRSSYAEGLGTLLAYEYQVPEIAETKISGLKKHFDITSDEGVEFFVVHQSADVFHSRSLKDAVDRLPPAEQELARKAVHETADALWNFLTETYDAA